MSRDEFKDLKKGDRFTCGTRTWEVWLARDGACPLRASIVQPNGVAGRAVSQFYLYNAEWMTALSQSESTKP